MTKEQMLEQFTVLGFALGMCVVERKEDKMRGTLDFVNVGGIRYYHNFVEV